MKENSMFRTSIALTLAVIGVVLVPFTKAQDKPPETPAEVPLDQRELNTALMESSFKIEGQSAQGKTTGTVFIMGRPTADPKTLRYVLITAAHILDGIQGDMAVLDLRRKVNDTDWALAPFPLQIRANGHQLWIKHPSADVAVMYVGMPKETAITLVPTTLLAGDKEISDYEIHAGDTLNVLGYPFGLTSNDAGFPVLRSGKIASYPLLPTAKTGTFLLDFAVFPGNSGGPVYLSESTRTYHGATHLGGFNFIAGLVSEEKLQTEQLIGIFSAEMHQYQLGLAVVVHASLIQQAIDMLPAADVQ
jgi:hypothetical protein